VLVISHAKVKQVLVSRFS